ncbi:MAG: hypothetical protein ACOC5T_07420 [Elusimicrobiota bacterium]
MQKEKYMDWRKLEKAQNKLRKKLKGNYPRNVARELEALISRNPDKDYTTFETLPRSSKRRLLNEMSKKEVEEELDKVKKEWEDILNEF